jgi:uncharacterized protein (TIGR00251 family)
LSASLAERSWCSIGADGAITLTVHAQPGAKRTEVAGVHGQGTQASLKLRLGAPPVDGKANAELIRYLADAFGVPLRNVTLLRGESARRKRVRINAPVDRPDRAWG